MGRNHKELLAGFARRFGGDGPLRILGFEAQGLYDGRKKQVGSRVVKLTGHGAKNGHIVQGVIPAKVVALVLFFNVAERVECSALIEFVEGNQVGKIEHVNFLELRGCAVFWGHHIKRDVAVVKDFCI